MPSIASFTAALALASTALATPVQLDKRAGFSVDQVQRSTFLKNGPAQIVKALRKHGKAVPDHLLVAADNANAVTTDAVGSGTAPADPSNSYDSSYLSPVTIGGKTVHLDFDTGSSDL